MKKAFYTVTTVLLIAVYCAMAVFALGDQAPSAEAPETVDLRGAWLVVAFTDGSNVTLITNEAMTFTDDTVSNFRDQFETPFVSCGYTYQNGDLSMPDIGKGYQVKATSDHAIRFYASPTAFMDLVRYPNEDLSPVAYDASLLVGSWNIAYRPGLEQIGQEDLVFTDATLTDIRNGQEAATIDYTWNDAGQIVIDRLGKIMRYLPISEDCVCFVETDTGYVWDLHRAAE